MRYHRQPGEVCSSVPETSECVNWLDQQLDHGANGAPRFARVRIPRDKLVHSRRQSTTAGNRACGASDALSFTALFSIARLVIDSRLLPQGMPIMTVPLVRFVYMRRFLVHNEYHKPRSQRTALCLESEQNAHRTMIRQIIALNIRPLIRFQFRRQ
jgi:hypothetical protein